jgi:DnaK suppressor protein
MVDKQDETPRQPGPRAHPDAEVTAEQTAELYKLLLEKRISVLGQRARHLDIGRFEERIPEAEEAAAHDTVQSTSIELAESERALLREIDRALLKLDHGTYGVSEGTEDPIGYARLKAVPWARYGIAHQEELERKARDRGATR